MADDEVYSGMGAGLIDIDEAPPDSNDEAAAIEEQAAAAANAAAGATVDGAAISTETKSEPAAPHSNGVSSSPAPRDVGLPSAMELAAMVVGSAASNAGIGSETKRNGSAAVESPGGADYVKLFEPVAKLITAIEKDTLAVHGLWEAQKAAANETDRASLLSKVGTPFCRVMSCRYLCRQRL